MKPGDSSLTHQPVHQKLAETCSMRGRQTDVLVQMEAFNLGPINSRVRRQDFQKFKLRSSRSSDDPSATTLGDPTPNRIRSLPGGVAAQRSSIRKYFELHAIHAPISAKNTVRNRGCRLYKTPFI